MKKISGILISLALLMLSVSYVPDFNQDLEIVRQRIIDELMKFRMNDSQIEILINTLQEDGSWPDRLCGCGYCREKCYNKAIGSQTNYHRLPVQHPDIV